MTILHLERQLFKPDLSQYPHFKRLSQYLWRGGKYGCMTQAIPRENGDVSWRQTWYPVAKEHGMLTRHNVYFGLYPVNSKLGEWKRGTITETASMGGLFAEFDLDKWQGEGELLDYLLGLDPAPNVINASGGGYHVYWIFKEPLILTDENREWAKEHLYAWVTLWKGDKAAKDLRRVLRVPGTYNFKKQYNPPRAVTCQFEDFTTLYDYLDLFALATPFVPLKTPTAGRRVFSVDLDNKRARRIVENALNELSTTPIDRHDTLIRKSRLLGGLVGAGVYPEHEARAVLEAGATQCGLVDMYGLRKIQHDISDGLRYGIAEPLTIENEYQPKEYPTMETQIQTSDNGHTQPTAIETQSRFFNTQIEKSVIGLLLREPDILYTQEWAINAGDFYLLKHQLLFAALLKMVERRIAIDDLQLIQFLNERGELEKVGGVDYIDQLMLVAYKPDYLLSYVEKVVELSEKRRAYELARDIQVALTEGTLDLDGMLSQVTSVTPRLKQTSVGIGDALDTDMARVYDVMSGQAPPYLRLGYADLDRFVRLDPTDFTILAGRPSMGKTALLLNFIRQMGVRTWGWWGEMSTIQIAQRLIAIESSILFQPLGLDRIGDGDLSDDYSIDGQKKSYENPSEWQRYSNALKAVKSLPLTVNDRPMTLSDFKREARIQVYQNGVQLIVMDYIDQLRLEGKKQNHEQEIAALSTGFKELAMELNTPVIALSQLSRAVDSRADKRPLLSDLRHSGQLEQDADRVIFIYRDDKYNENSETPNQAEIIVAKQRNGATGTAALYFEKFTGRFKELMKQNIDLSTYKGGR